MRSGAHGWLCLQARGSKPSRAARRLGDSFLMGWKIRRGARAALRLTDPDLVDDLVATGAVTAKTIGRMDKLLASAASKSPTTASALLHPWNATASWSKPVSRGMATTAHTGAPRPLARVPALTWPKAARATLHRHSPCLERPLRGPLACDKPSHAVPA